MQIFSMTDKHSAIYPWHSVSISTVSITKFIASSMAYA